MDLNKSGIYAIRNVVNGKVYVGKTSQPFHSRWRTHRRLLQSGRHDNRHLQSSWLKYGGSSFEFSILEEIPRDQPLMIGQRESYWATILKASDRVYGYNLEVVVPDGHTISEETRERQRAAHLGKKQSPEAIAKTAAAHRGMKRSSETRARLRQANTGQIMSENQRALLSLSRRGIPLSEEWRAHMSAVRKGKTPTRLTAQDREDIVRRYETGETRNALASEYGVRPNYVSMLRSKAQKARAQGTTIIGADEAWDLVGGRP
jgi:group I intron endonuclease